MLELSRRSRIYRSLASVSANKMTRSEYQRFINLRPTIKTPPPKPSLMTTSACVLKRYVDMTQSCLTPLLILRTIHT